MNELQVIYREQGPGSPKRFEVRDLKLLLVLSLLWPVSWFLPPAWWPRIAALISRYKELVPWEAYPEEIPTLRSVYGNKHAVQKLAEIELSVDLHRHLLRMLILRQLSPWGWRPLIDCEGINNLENALARGKGVILWMSHFIYNGLVGKMGLHKHGFQVHHVSRPEHGFSKTRFGILTVNQLRVGAEAPFLAGRIVIERGSSQSVKKQISEILSGNGIVSITAGAWEGRQVVEGCLFNKKIRLATGAPGLAFTTGAALLPVFGFKTDGVDNFRVEIGRPLDIDGSPDRISAIRQATAAFLHGTEHHVRAHPDQWRSWTRLDLP